MSSFFVFFLFCFSNLAVVERRIFQNLIDIGEEILATLVLLLAQVLADRLQIHRPGDNAEVVGHRFAADWKQERLHIGKDAHFIEDFLEHGGERHHWISPTPVSRFAVTAQIVAVGHCSGPPPLPR